MRRRLFNLAFNLAAVVSLVLFFATAALWVRSVNTGDRYGWTRVAGERGRRGEIVSGRGLIVVSFDTAETPFISGGYADEPGKGWEHGELPYIMHEVDSYGMRVSSFHEWSFYGVTLQLFDGCAHVFVRDATVVVLTGVLPALWMVQFVRRTMKTRTFCSAVLLVACLGTAGLWMRSHFRMHGVLLSSGPFWFGVMTNENRIEFFGWDIREGGISASLIGMPPRVWTDYPVREGPEWRWWNLGFGRERGGMTPGYSYYIP